MSVQDYQIGKEMDILFTLNYYETDYIFYRYAASLFKNYRKSLRRITLNYISANDSYLIFISIRECGKITCIYWYQKCAGSDKNEYICRNVNDLRLCRTYELSNEVSRPDDDRCAL